MADFFNDPSSRLQELIAHVAPKFRARFLDVVRSVKDSVVLDQIQALLESGQVDEALVTVEVAALKLSNTFGEVMILSGHQTAEVIGEALQVIVNFDQVNTAALDAMTRNQLRLVREFMNEQRLATQEALIEGIRRGLNPREQALAFRDSIGLTQYQQQIVNNYRRNLENLEANALGRALRDRRFDRTVAAALDSGTALTQAQVDRMVERYTERWIKYRAEVIARTEALRSVHEGSNLMYQQAIESGTLTEGDLERTWDPSGDSRVRDSHAAMYGQKRGMGQPFLSGLGNSLMYPGDISAPGEDTIQCRCAVTTRFSNRAKLEAQQYLTSLVTTS